MESPESCCSDAKLSNLLLLLKIEHNLIENLMQSIPEMDLEWAYCWVFVSCIHIKRLNNWEDGEIGWWISMVQCRTLSSALEMHGDPVFISFYVSSKASLSLQNLYVRIASDVYGWTILCWSFAPVATTIFGHILGNGQCHRTPIPSGGCWCQCRLPFSFTLLPWVVM